MSRPVQEWRFEVGAPHHGDRLDAFLGRHLRWRSRSSIRKSVLAGWLEVRPFKDPQQAPVARLRPGLKLRRGQEVVVRLPSAPVEAGKEAKAWKPVLGPAVFEDDHLLAVCKPPHLNVYPSRRHRGPSLVELVHRRHHELFGAPVYAPALCHRLDRETSGLVVFAKNRSARAALGLQFEERRVTKTYLAVVTGTVEEREGVIDLPLGPATGSRVETKVGVCSPPAGAPAHTRWRRIQRMGGRTLVELSPRTGRRHQLRVHMAAIGHPIVGDKLYLGGDEIFLRSLEGPLTPADRARLGLDRQALHAWRLELTHPGDGDGRLLQLEAPLWPDVVALAGSSAAI